MRKKNTAILWAFFLGGIGAHRFYLGQTGLGILYLLFCWTFIPSIISVIDIVIFLGQDDSKFNTKYNLSNHINSISNLHINQDYKKNEEVIVNVPDTCPHCKNPNSKKIRLCEWCGNQII